MGFGVESLFRHQPFRVNGLGFLPKKKPAVGAGELIGRRRIGALSDTEGSLFAAVTRS